MEVFLTNVVIIQYLYSLDIPGWVNIIKFGFSLYPPFNFSKAFSDIAQKAGSHFDTYQFKWVYGNGYFWEDFIKRQKGQLRGDVFYDIPSTAQTMVYMILDILFFAVLTWYFDHVSEGNRGRQFSKLFFFEKKYWFGSKKVIQSKSENTEDQDETLIKVSKDDVFPINCNYNYNVNSFKRVFFCRYLRCWIKICRIRKRKNTTTRRVK